MWNMFKANNKDIVTTSLLRTSFWCLYYQLWTYFTTFSNVSIVDFEQVNASWEVIMILRSQSTLKNQNLKNEFLLDQCCYLTKTKARYVFQSIKCQCCPHIEPSQLTGFYIRATLAFNGWNKNKANSVSLYFPAKYLLKLNSQFRYSLT